MRRREFITLLCGAAATWQGLQELGWTDGRNVQIETRFGGTDASRIRAHAAQLVALAPDVIVGNTTPVIRALRQATSFIPVVMAGVNDPVAQGFVSSLAHPGGNITGFTFVDFQMVGKWLEMLKEAAPGVSRAVLMFNPDTSPYYYLYLRSFEAEPRSVAIEVTAAPVRATAEIEDAVAKLGREPGGGLIVPPDAFNTVHHQLLIRLAQQHRLPAVYAFRAYVLGRRLDVVWTRCLRHVPALSFLCRSHFEGSQTGRSSRSAANEVGTCDQPQDRQSARPPNSRQAAGPRRRGDRVVRFFAAPAHVRCWHCVTSNAGPHGGA